MVDRSRLVQRILEEYQTVPGLKLTEAQAARLWSAPESVCHTALVSLVQEGLLWLAPSGRYLALPESGPGPLKADLHSVRCPYCLKRQTAPATEAAHAREIEVTLRCGACQRVFTVKRPAA